MTCEYFLRYSNLFITFAKVAYGFIKCCFTCPEFSEVNIGVDIAKIDWLVRLADEGKCGG